MFQIIGEEISNQKSCMGLPLNTLCNQFIEVRLSVIKFSHR